MKLLLEMKGDDEMAKPRIAHATHDERHKYSGGKAGDQGNTEVFIREWYNRPWNYVIRFKDPVMAEKVALAMERACKNDNIGYDQYQRNTLLKEARKYNYDPGKVTIPVETDCSALVSLACMYAGVPENKLFIDGNSATTSVIRRRLFNTGLVEVFSAKKYTSSGDYCNRGDILLYEGHHVAVQIEDGDKATPRVITKPINEVPEEKVEVTGTEMIGRITANALNIRNAAGTHGKLLGVFKKNDYVSITKVENNWGYANEKGWISLNYVDKKSAVKGKVTASSLNVRKGAGTSYDRITSISNDTTVVITKMNPEGTWGYDRESKGWVSLKYIELDKV